MSAARVVLVGAESTGKTTLARDLSAALGGAPWVPEYGREYTVLKLAREGGRMEELVWTTADFLSIAREQNALEASATVGGAPILICDTDTFATAVWHERYLGARSAEVEALAITRPSLYLLSHPDDVPFEPDEIRDGEHLRAWMTDAFVERLRGGAHRVVSIRGTREERVAAALRAIEAWLA